MTEEQLTALMMSTFGVPGTTAAGLPCNKPGYPPCPPPAPRPGGGASVKGRLPLNSGTLKQQYPAPGSACGCGGVIQAEQAETETTTTMAFTNENMESETYQPGVGPLQVQGGACGVYRGWGSGQPVSMATGPCTQDACDPGNPGGLWVVPAEITVPAAGSFVIELTTPRPANLWAVVVHRVTGTAIANISFSAWQTQAVNVSYPKWGKDTSVPDPNSALVPASAYAADFILAGQNPLPPWVPRYNMQDTNSVLKNTIANADAVNAAIVTLLFVVNYG